jgi:hypothetical protein
MIYILYILVVIYIYIELLLKIDLLSKKKRENTNYKLQITQPTTAPPQLPSKQSQQSQFMLKATVRETQIAVHPHFDSMIQRLTLTL